MLRHLRDPIWYARRRVRCSGAFQHGLAQEARFGEVNSLPNPQACLWNVVDVGSVQGEPGRTQSSCPRLVFGFCLQQPSISLAPRCICRKQHPKGAIHRPFGEMRLLIRHHRRQRAHSLLLPAALAFHRSRPRACEQFRGFRSWQIR